MMRYYYYNLEIHRRIEYDVMVLNYGILFVFKGKLGRERER